MEISTIRFEESDNGGACDTFVRKYNNSQIRQHWKMHLIIWFANRSLQIVLDEGQAIRHIVKYAPKPKKQFMDMNDHLCYLIQKNVSD